MADYRLVDADKLDADLTTVADAIRERGGTTEPLAFPDGMVAAVKAIPEASNQTLNDLLSRNITEIYNAQIGTLGSYALNGARNLVSIDFPKLITVGEASIQNCPKLVSINIPRVTSIGANAIRGASSLLFVDLPKVTSIKNDAFRHDTALETIILRHNGIVSLSNSTVFDNTAITNGNGYFYVPAALVDSYKVATNWSAHADRIRAIEDYPEITGGAT